MEVFFNEIQQEPAIIIRITQIRQKMQQIKLQMGEKQGLVITVSQDFVQSQGEGTEGQRAKSQFEKTWEDHPIVQVLCALMNECVAYVYKTYKVQGF